VIRVLWTEEARSDLRNIRDFIAHDSPRHAELVVSELIAVVRRLESFPESGRMVPERRESTLREVIWRNYRIVYRYPAVPDEVHVLMVFGAQRQF
jgi:toxin ParE1/3/4